MPGPTSTRTTAWWSSACTPPSSTSSTTSTTSAEPSRTCRSTYPIAVDNDYAIWTGFDNHYWPALYFVDAQGQIRHHRFGEGDYEQSEMIIQQLLTEAGAEGVGHDLVSVDAGGVEAAADWDSLWSQENYLGYERTENFASSNDAVLDTSPRLCRPGAVAAQPLGPVG